MWIQTHNDFRTTLLWLRSLEIINGYSSILMMSELEMADLFSIYRSPWKA